MLWCSRDESTSVDGQNGGETPVVVARANDKQPQGSSLFADWDFDTLVPNSVRELETVGELLQHRAMFGTPLCSRQVWRGERNPEDLKLMFTTS